MHYPSDVDLYFNVVRLLAFHLLHWIVPEVS